jgi:hypothetical protein
VDQLGVALDGLLKLSDDVIFLKIAKQRKNFADLLDRDIALEQRVLPTVHGPDAAFADLIDTLITLFHPDPPIIPASNLVDAPL